MKAFHNKKIIAYPHQNLYTSKWVVRSQELSLCPLEEIKKELKSQGLTDVKRVSIKRNNKIIHTNRYIMTLELPVITPKIKIGYTVERVGQFIPNHLRCYKCQKYRHHQDKCNGKSVCGKCGQKEPDHSIDECKNTHRCANCGGDHPAYSKTCEKWKREREILSIKYTKNIFPRSTKDSWSYKQRENLFSSSSLTNPYRSYKRLSESSQKIATA